ncbi:MAG: TfoX/Sxy family DNA transformation protein [Pseudoclavibacter sp.]|nr:TfoX/Sxy family DNA transformation protein [Pseudoclavibacter sp.]
MSDLTELPNVGPALSRALRQAGIDTPAKLIEAGSVEAWQRIHPTFDCFHSLLALEGAVQGIPKNRLDQETRRRLKNEMHHG